MITKEEYEKLEVTDPVPDQHINHRDWGRWNLAPHTEEEILHRAIHSMLTKDESFCYIYCLGFPGNATPKLIDELIYVDSGLFEFGGYCDKTRDIVIDLAIKKKDVYSEIKTLSESNDPDIPQAFKNGCANALIRAEEDKKFRLDATKHYIDELKSDLERAETGKSRRFLSSQYINAKISEIKRKLDTAEERYERRLNSPPKIFVTEKIPWGDVVDSLPKDYLKLRLPLIKKTASIETVEALKRRGILKGKFLQDITQFDQ